VKNIGYWLIEATEKDEEEGMIEARAMLLGSKQEADEVKAQLNGDNFAELADKYSQYDTTHKGGELDWLKPGSISEAFDEATFNLGLNTISEPIRDESMQTEGGYWIIRVLEKGNHELSQDVKETLKVKSFNEWFNKQKENSTIVNHLDAEKKAWALDTVSRGR
ncbi:MAG: peptidylprolyl isomerase, partial [Chloroflexota bacterium]|nr:peptidylprolyl isomerase [Chloroflexota bacterium]